MRILIALLLVGLCLESALIHAAEDIAGARDPGGIARYPRSWIVDYGAELELLPRDFVVSRVDRIRRDLHVEGLIRIDAASERAIYELPEGTALEAVVAHYRQVLGGEVLFSCAARDCGRSNDWANQIFQKAILYGPDRTQHYLAVQREAELYSLYVVERGNRRVYARLEVLSPRDTPGAAKQTAQPIQNQGWMIVKGLQPRADGSLPVQAAAVLAEIAPGLTDLQDGVLYVVCHLAEGGDSAALIAASSACAAEVVALLGPMMPVPGPEIRGFGAGPLLPRPAAPGNRVELVLPVSPATDSGAGTGQ